MDPEKSGWKEDMKSEVKAQEAGNYRLAALLISVLTFCVLLGAGLYMVIDNPFGFVVKEDSVSDLTLLGDIVIVIWFSLLLIAPILSFFLVISTKPKIPLRPILVVDKPITIAQRVENMLGVYVGWRVNSKFILCEEGAVIRGLLYRWSRFRSFTASRQRNRFKLKISRGYSIWLSSRENFDEMFRILSEHINFH